MNYSLFDEIEKDKNLFYCKNNKGTDAKAIYSSSGITILFGSKISKDMVDSFSGKESRLETLKGYSQEKDNYFDLTKNIEFLRPSSASSFCLGRSSNGWIDWKDKKGNTLDKVIRQIQD